MTTDVASTLLREVCFLQPAGALTVTAPAYSFRRDFDPPLAWPDAAYDTSMPSSHYDKSSRSELLKVMSDASDFARARAPKAFVFVDKEVDSVMLRRSTAVAGACSASNPSHIGVCLFTNLHLAPDRILACAEGLVHEAIHQHLYRTEREHGGFCDFGESKRFHSPWTGNKVPLHSLVHATLVGFGMLTLWCQLAQSSADRGETALVGERVARTLFGYTFVTRMMESRVFPFASIEPRILKLIDHVARIPAALAHSAEKAQTAGDMLRCCEDGRWVRRLASTVERMAQPIAA